MEKQIVVILRKPPQGSLYTAEGLRVAVAVSASEPTIIALEDSIYAFLKDADMTLYKHHFDFLQELDISVLIDHAALLERGLDQEHLIEGVSITKHRDLLRIIAKADTTLTF
jgi:sulfur relay (sulfurtransferase) DsrF/TusC family protein